MADRAAQQRVLAQVDPADLVGLASAHPDPELQDGGDARRAVPRPVLPRARLPRRAARGRARAPVRRGANVNPGAAVLLLVGWPGTPLAPSALLSVVGSHVPCCSYPRNAVWPPRARSRRR